MFLNPICLRFLPNLYIFFLRDIVFCDDVVSGISKGYAIVVVRDIVICDDVDAGTPELDSIPVVRDVVACDDVATGIIE